MTSVVLAADAWTRLPGERPFVLSEDAELLDEHHIRRARTAIVTLTGVSSRT
ncbi:MAG: hypothetical protein ACREQ5_29635 [Candidatus Dormibacteria bacterium]